MDVIKLLTNYNHNTGTEDRIKYIVVHYTGATSSAKANCVYFQQGNRGASAHYFVDHDGSIWQSVEDKDIAWHCGGKQYYHPECRNSNSLGIEMCCRNNSADKSASSTGWYFEEATVKATIELVKELMAKYNVPLENVLRHYDITHKCCPNPYVLSPEKWADFKNQLAEIKEGWTSTNGKWCYVKNGKKVTGWQVIDHYKYYFDEVGYMLTGWQFVDNGWFYFEEPEYSNEGAMWIAEEDGRQHRLYVA